MGVRPDRGTGKDWKWVFAQTGEPGKTGSEYSPGPGNIIVYCEKPIYVMLTRLVVGVRPDRET